MKKGMIVSFRLTIGLGVIGRGGHVVGLKQNTYSFKEVGDKLRSIIGLQYFRHTLRPNPKLKKSVGDLGAVLDARRIARASFEKRSVITKKLVEQWSVVLKGPRRSIATNSRGAEGAKRRRGL